MVSLPKLAELDDLPLIPELADIPTFESLDDEDCEPCGAIKDELQVRCQRITSNPEAVNACVTDLGRVVSDMKKSGSQDGVRDRMYEVFLKYRERPPEAVENVAAAPAEEASSFPTTTE